MNPHTSIVLLLSYITIDSVHNVTIVLLYSDLMLRDELKCNSVYNSSLSMHSSSIVLYSVYIVLGELKLINSIAHSSNIDMLTHNTS